ncbi:MAG: hypothetical protein GX556_18095 [Fibrobacter sp.]|nr:hypothetical protein [Fibrobacter sp.]
MIKHELISRSPLRILEKTTQGGVGKGNIGVIAARKGTGKTACLVHIATDQLFQGKHLIHVSFAPDTSHIVSWYEDIFEEIAHRYKLDSAMDIHDDIIRRRVIMNFRQDGIKADQVQKSIRSLIQDGNFLADMIIVDGYDFTKVSAEEFSSFKKFAMDMGIEIWFSATLHREGKLLANRVPELLKDLINDIDVLILLEPKDTYVRLSLIKDHEISQTEELNLKLDPQILLIAEES